VQQQNAAASANKPPAFAGASQYGPAHQGQQSNDDGVQQQVQENNAKRKPGNRIQSQGKRQCPMPLGHMQQGGELDAEDSQAEGRQDEDSEDEGSEPEDSAPQDSEPEDSEAEMEDELLLTSEAGKVSAGQNWQLLKQLEQVRLRHEQMLQEMQQQHKAQLAVAQAEMQQYRQQHEAQLAVAQAERQQMQQQIQQLLAQLQMLPDRQLEQQQPAVGQLPGQEQHRQRPGSAIGAAAAPAETAAAPNHVDFSGIVHLTKVYDSTLPRDVYVRMGPPVGDGATAVVFRGVLCVSNNGVEEELGQVAVKPVDAAYLNAQELSVGRGVDGIDAMA
jgi:hypothetical protein